MDAPSVDGQGAILPWLHRNLERAGLLDHLPPETARHLAGARRAAAMLHLQRRSAVRAVLAEFAGRGLPVAAVKGLALAVQVYPDPALRPMSDVDLWVRPGDLERADLALKEAGLRYPDRTHDGLQLPTAAEALVERSYELAGTRVLVELHGALKSFGALPPARVDRVWQRLVPIELAGAPVRVMHPEDQLLHLVLHAADQHRYSLGLGPLLDLTLALRHWHRSLDWPAMRRDWEELGITTWMTTTLALARDLLDAPVPAGVNPGPSPAMAELRELALEQIWHPHQLLPGAMERVTSRGGGWLVRRLGAYWEPAPGAAWWRYPVIVGRRVAHDLRVKIPRYVRGGWQVRRRLAEGRRRIGEIATAVSRKP